MSSEEKQNAINDPASPSLEKEVHGATRSVLWAQLGTQFLSFASLAFLYRWIDPEQFGLLGMIMPIVLLSRSIGTLGLNVAAVQHKELNHSQASTLFWLQLAFGAGFALLLAILSPLLAAAYSSPQLTIIGVSIAGTAFLANCLTQHQAMIERKLQLGRLVKIRLVAQALSATVAVVMAYYQFGIWALVTQQYMELIVLNIGLWRAEPWRPGFPQFDKSIKPMLKFGGYYTLSGLLFALAQNLDKILLAYWLGGSATGQQLLGFYTQAFSQMMKPVYMMTTPITGAMLPALSKAQVSAEQFAKITINYYRIVAVALAPCTVGLFLVAQDLMQVLGGDQWKQSGQILSILALTIMLQGLVNISGSLLSSVGKTGMLAMGAFVFLLVMLQSYFGAYWLASDMPNQEENLVLLVAWAFALSTGIVAVPYLIFCFTLAGIPATELYRLVRSPLLFASVMGVCVYFTGQAISSFDDLPISIHLLIKVAVGVAIYGILARVEIKWLMTHFRSYQESN